MGARNHEKTKGSSYSGVASCIRIFEQLSGRCELALAEKASQFIGVDYPTRSRNKGVGSIFKIDLKEQQAIGGSIGRGRPAPTEALEEMASTMSLLGIEFYKSPAIIVHDPGDEARFVSNRCF